MLSYALASLKIERPKYKENTSKNYKGVGIFGFVKNRELSVIKELDKYGRINANTVDRLTNILEKNNFNVRMLVAVDIWYRGNDNPKKFTSDMFTKSNFHFVNISSVSFDNKKVWDKDSLSTFLIYANYLKDNVYAETDDVRVVSEDYSGYINDNGSMDEYYD